MMTMTGKEKRQTLQAVPGTGTPDLIHPRQRQSGKARLKRIGRRSVCGYALAGCLVIALGLTWTLGLVGCTPTAGSGRAEETTGTIFPSSRQSPLEVSRLLRNAHYYKLMGRPELALKELEQAYQQNPENLKLVDALAQSYQELGQFESARKIYQEALNKQGPHPALANNLCFTYYLEGRFQEAETCYRQTLARDPGNEAARNNLGLLYCRLGRTDEARRLWQEVEGLAAADYKTRQALGALGMADRPVYAQKTEPAAVATLSLTVTAAPQKIAMQLPPPPAHEIPEPALDKPLDEVQEQLEPAKAPPARDPGAVAARTPALAKAAPDASPRTPVAAVSPPPPPAPGPLPVAPAPAPPPKVAQELAPLPAPEKPVPSNHRPLAQAQPKPKPEQARSSPAPAAQPASRPAPLTCAELVDTAIEVRNGTPAPHLARDMRSLLSQEAFTVAVIGNHVDFGAAKTVIYYRPEALRVAQALQTEIFPMAALEPSHRLRDKVAIKVLLGNDLFNNQDLMARLEEDGANPVAAETALTQVDQLAPVAAAPAAIANQTLSPPASEPLTAPGLMLTTIEVLNGTRTAHLARRTRTLLTQEGFSVTRIGNYINFGAERTIIYYRPEARRVAQALGETLFPGAGLEPSMKLRKDIGVQILLGADLMDRPQLVARLAIEGP